MLSSMFESLIADVRDKHLGLSQFLRSVDAYGCMRRETMS